MAFAASVFAISPDGGSYPVFVKLVGNLYFKMLKKLGITTDPVADLLTRIRNTSCKRAPSVRLPYSKLKEKIARLLEEEGYLGPVKKEIDLSRVAHLQIGLRYHDDKPLIQGLKRVSKPGRRIYASARQLPWVLSGHGLAIVSTSRGLMTDQEARKRKLGGEVLFFVW